MKQTEYIKEIIREKEYLKDGIERRIVIVHIPFTKKMNKPKFQIEGEIYTEWANLLKNEIKPVGNTALKALKIPKSSCR